MNPSNPETSGMKLPPPVIEQAPPASAKPEKGKFSPERQRGVGERAPTPIKQGTAAPAIPIPTPPVIPQVAGRAAQLPTASPTAGLGASDDNDLIEKEWVNKAKQIVERTRDDPYKQSEELTVVKVDYMKKRYNKTLKLNK